MGKLRLTLSHVVPHIWFYKQKEILGACDSNNDHSEAAFVYRRATSMRLVKSGSSTDGKGSSPVSQNTSDQVSESPRKRSNAKPIKPERFRKGKEIQVCTVVDAGCTCRATMTSQHKDKGKSQRNGARSSMVSRLVCRGTEDAVRKPNSEEAAGPARDRVVGGDAKDRDESLKTDKMYLDGRELEKRLRSVGLHEKRKKKVQGSPECLARVPSPVPLCSVSSTHFATRETSPSNNSTMGVEDSSIRFSDERSSFSRMSSSVSSCRLSTPELAMEGRASCCEDMKPYMSEEAAGSCLLRRLDSGFSSNSPAEEPAISEKLGNLRARRVDDSNVHRASQHHWSEKSSHENNHSSLRKKSKRKKQQELEAPPLMCQSQYRERPLLIQEDDNVLQMKQLQGGTCSSDQPEFSLRGGDLPLNMPERKDSSAPCDAKIQLLQHYPSKVSSMEQVASSSNLSQQAHIERDHEQQQVANEEEEEEEEDACRLRRISRKSEANPHHRRGKELKKLADSGQFASEEIVSAIAELAKRNKGIDDDPPPASSPESHEIFNSIAMVKSSYNPQRDFKESMMEMVLAKHLSSSEDLEQLLQCYLSLNAEQYHHIIVEVFQELWADLFENTN